MNAKQIPKLKAKDIERFLNSIDFSSNCWNWNKSIYKGYGCFYFSGDDYKAHRISYELFRREIIPLNMTIDHLCRNRKCVNPFHLEIVSLSVNSRRGNLGTHRRDKICKVAFSI